MGTAIVKIKIMPQNPETDLEKIKIEAERIISENSGEVGKTEEQPIAFGLRALILTFQLDENTELEPIEKKLEEIPEVNSVQVIDMRRALG